MGVELVRKVKAMATEEYVRSTEDLLVLKGRPHYTVHNTYIVSDLRYAGFREHDWGWGKPSIAGPADVGLEVASFLLTFINGNGENGILVPICLPESTMESFMIECKKKVHSELGLLRKALSKNISSIRKNKGNLFPLPATNVGLCFHLSHVIFWNNSLYT